MLKEHIAGSALGHMAMAARDRLSMWQASIEHVGSRSNDLIADKLISSIGLPNRTFLDVGAHIGSFMALVHHAVPSMKIIGFEAIPEKAKRLRDRFRYARIHQVALADRGGEATFFVDLDQSGYSSLAGGRASVREITVPLATMDSLVTSDDVDTIKIDVEGAELAVLRGGAGVLRRCRPTVMFESGPGEVLGYTKEHLWTFFDDAGYKVFVPNRVAHTAPGLTLEGFLESHCYPFRTLNYVAVASERVDEIRERARAVLA